MPQKKTMTTKKERILMMPNDSIEYKGVCQIKNKPQQMEQNKSPELNWKQNQMEWNGIELN